MELASRAIYRGQVTKLVKSASEFLQSDNAKISEQLDHLDSIEEDLTVLLDRLTVAYDSLQRANSEVRASIKPEDFEKEAESIADYNDKAIGTIARINQRLKKVRQSQDQLFNASVRAPISDSASPKENSRAVKLQKLNLKTFSGDFKEWVPFWEQYRTLVHENTSLNTIDKFNYLETVLKGKAANTIAGLTPSAACYDVAIALLKEEYGNMEKIVDHTMQNLLSTQPVALRSDASGLRRLYNSVLASTRSLSSLGIPSSNYFVMLKGVLLRCLPNDLRVDFHRFYDDLCESQKGETDHGENDNKNDGEASTSAATETTSMNSIGDKQVKCLLKFLKREVESLEKASEAKPHKHRQTNINSQPVSTALGLFTTSANENSCFFCKRSDHGAKECSSIKSLSERKQMLKNDGRCYRCCQRGHNSKYCRNKSIVCRKCKGRHATCMCDPQYTKLKAASNSVGADKGCVTNMTTTPSSSVQQTLNLCTTHTAQENFDVYLQTACAFASHEHSTKALYVRVVLDGGSQMSFIKTSVARRLNLPIVSTHNLSVIPFGSDKRTPSKYCNKVRFMLRSQYGDRAVILDALEVPEICFDVLSMPNTNESCFSELSLADVRIFGDRLEEGISVLIGADVYWQFATGEHQRLTDKLTAVNTILGWTLQGPSPNCRLSVNLSCVASLNVCACKEIKIFWELEALGINSESEKRAGTDFSAYTIKKDTRYEASLLWKEDKSTLHDNRGGALVRMKSLVRKLCATNKIIEYDEAMTDLICKGIAERAPEVSDSDHVYYLPHRAVYRDDKETSKLRIVFDASAHEQNHKSLNEHLETGANLLPDILAILLNFRCGKIGIVADIEKAFLQVSLHPKDRDSHRFFWFAEKITETKNLPPVQIYRMTRVTFGVTCSPYLLGATLLKVLDEAFYRYSETVAALKSSFYMDDLIISTDSDIIASKIYKEATLILKDASMELHKWNSNSCNLRKRFTREEKLPRIQKVLGLIWHVLTDELSVNLEVAENLLSSGKLQGTKRNVLKVMATIFDPFGILGPWIVRMKLLFQEIWRKKLNWDELLPKDLLAVWTTCCADMHELREIAIPRSVSSKEDISQSQLHIFADASLHAYGAVAYLRIVRNNNVSTCFLCAKHRVAPIKECDLPELTLPKLELTAALIAARLLNYLRQNLKTVPNTVWLWTDSKITLHWIRGNKKKWKPYVTNRVSEIHAHSEKSSWRHCPGSNNPADLLTRGISAKALVNSPVWYFGPEWLLRAEITWPSIDIHDMEDINTTALLVLSSGVPPKERDTDPASDNMQPILQIERFSRWTRLLRVTAYVIRFINKLKRTPQDRMQFLSAVELRRAESYWILLTQRAYYQVEREALLNGKGIPKNSNLIMLCPILDKEYLRVGGRLQYATSEISEPHPIILPKSSYVARLIVQDMHERTLHGGVSLILTRLREKYWITQGRQLVRKICNSCVVCKILRGKPASQPFAPLPRDRISLSRPFDVTGLDFAGPLYTKEIAAEGARKCYILLFTCAAVRAVHLELTPDLSTESCLLGLRRFIARRGVPSVIYSDNAKTFKRASLELRKLEKLINSEELHGFISNHGISWKFIVERAPWWGGFWERLVRTIKDPLKAVLRRTTLDNDHLHTLLTEIENAVNNRPLTYVGEDPLDLTPLTPAHFLVGCSATSLSLADVKEEDLKAKELRQIWKQRLRALSTFRRRWYHEYIQQLRSLHHCKPTSSSNVRPGDVVLLHDASLPRLFWRLAIVEETYVGRDGKVRSCMIRLHNGSQLKRPVQLLYPLEIN